jgi:hypothetical protein
VVALVTLAVANDERAIVGQAAWIVPVAATGSGRRCHWIVIS